MTLDRTELEAELVDETLGVLLKYEDDLTRIRGKVAEKTLESVKKGLAPTG
jgi:hypothetical protein